MRVVIRRLRDAKHDFYGAQTATKKRRLRFAIYQAFAELAQHELSWMKQHLGLDVDDSEQIRAHLYEYQQAEHALGEIRRELDAARKLKTARRKTHSNVFACGGMIRKLRPLSGILTSPKCFIAFPTVHRLKSF